MRRAIVRFPVPASPRSKIGTWLCESSRIAICTAIMLGLAASTNVSNSRAAASGSCCPESCVRIVPLRLLGAKVQPRSKARNSNFLSCRHRGSVGSIGGGKIRLVARASPELRSGNSLLRTAQEKVPQKGKVSRKTTVNFWLINTARHFLSSAKNGQELEHSGQGKDVRPSFGRSTKDGVNH